MQLWLRKEDLPPTGSGLDRIAQKQLKQRVTAVGSTSELPALQARL
jgi:hypothetical protein